MTPEIEAAEQQLATLKKLHNKTGQDIAQLTAVHENVAKIIAETTITLANLRLQAK